jgi:hypothetical protein
MEFPPEADAPKDIPNQEFKTIFEPNQINVKQSDACSAARAKQRPVLEHCERSHSSSYT